LNSFRQHPSQLLHVIGADAVHQPLTASMSLTLMTPFTPAGFGAGAGAVAATASALRACFRFLRFIFAFVLTFSGVIVYL
jgi:hypothetical protein